VNESSARRRVKKEPTRRVRGRFHSLLVPVDLTPSSDRVLGRVPLLPLADKARVTLLHVVPENLPPPDRRKAERDAKKALAEEERHLRKSLVKTVSTASIVVSGAAASEIAARAAAIKAELIVMGRGGGRALRDVFLGSTAERVIRQSQLPVLVVRVSPRSVYIRPAVALDLEHDASDILGLMLRVVQTPRPRVAIIHAFDVPHRGLTYPTLFKHEADELKDKLALQASHKVAKVLATSLVQAGVLSPDMPRWKPLIRYGSPRIVIERAVKQANTDLLVLGTRGHTGVAYVFLGTVAGDVLREVPCDVLVVPPHPSIRRRAAG
jgi:nucleotide-binding universal stress UspA family protein